jgi:hypothetical protein
MPALRPLLTTMVLAALVAAPSGFAATSHRTTHRTVVPALHLRLPLTLSSAKTATGAKNRTCQAQSSQRKGLPNRTAIIGDPRRIAIVACEQPPRSEPFRPSSLETSAVAAEG